MEHLGIELGKFVGGSWVVSRKGDPSPKISGTKNGGTKVTYFQAILGVGFPLHKPYPYSLHR